MPDWKAEIAARLAGLKVDPEREAEIIEELTQHLEDRYQELLSHGTPAEDAWRAIQKEWEKGGKLMDELKKIEHVTRHEPIAWGAQIGRNLIGALAFDFRSAIKSLARSPWFAVGAALTFALGIGVNVAVFSAVDRVLFRPLPYERVDEIVQMGEYGPGAERPYGTLPASYVPAARHLSSIVDGCVAGWTLSYAIAREPGGEPPIRLTQVSFNTLTVFGVRPYMGRSFVKEDAQKQFATGLISYDVWQRRFNAAPDVIGRRLWSSGKPTEIIGVLPPGFIPASSFLDPGSDGLALDYDTLDSAPPGERQAPPNLRIRPGVSLAAAQAEVDALVEHLKQAEPAPRPGTPKTAIRLVPLRKVLFGAYTTYVWVVVAAAALVLLVACANLASLLLVRGRSREHQAAVRMALGASISRIIRSALIESLALSIAGTCAGLLVLAWAAKGLQVLLPPVFSRYAAPAYDIRVIIFAILAATLSALIAGTLPCLRLSSMNITSVLQQVAGRGIAGKLRGGRTLLVVEAAVSIVLIAGATMAARSLISLLRTDLGFEPEHLYNVQVQLPFSAAKEAELAQYLQVLDELRQLRNVQSAGAANVSPISGAVGYRFGGGFKEGSRNYVTDGFIEAAGMRVLAGRAFEATDAAHPDSVGILSELGLHQVWPGLRPAEAIGRMLEFPGEAPRQVIGIVSDIRYLYNRPARPLLYVPMSAKDFRVFMLVVRMQPGSVLSAAELRNRFRARVDSPQAIGAMYEPDFLSSSLYNQKFIALLFSTFGIVALFLAAAGLYAVASLEVAMRRSEMGLRMSLGATSGNVQRLIIRETLFPVIVGLGIGTAVAYWASKFAQTWWYKIDSRDPITYLLAAAVLIVSTAFAAWLPARRAARIDPMAALRCE